MKTLTLLRTYIPNGTRGLLLDDAGKDFCKSIERTKNDADHPCIPEGTYLVGWYDSPKHGRCFLLKNVPGRTMIEIHDCKGHKESGEIVELDYVRVGFLLGCIGPGLYECEAHGELAVCGAPAALHKLKDYIGKDKQFYLKIEELK